MRRRTFLFLGAAVTLPVCFNCLRRAKMPPVILIVLDTVRADHLSCYGWHRPTSPGIDALAKEGALFTRAFSPIAHTLPAHHTLFTSRHPREHKVLSNGWRPLQKFPLLTEALAQAGFETAAVVSSEVVHSKFGLAPGFDFYGDRFAAFNLKRRDGKMVRLWKRPADEVVDEALRWLKREPPGQPFFLFLHFYDAHLRYELTPKRYRRRFASDDELLQLMASRNQKAEFAPDINLYDGSIRFIDDSLGRLWHALRERGDDEGALIIITSDHGEGLGEHDWYGHNISVYEEQMHIPLILRFPGKAYAGRKCDALVDLVDVAPTILDFLGLPPLPGARGKSLLPLLRGEVRAVREAVFYERKWYPLLGRPEFKNSGEMFGVRTERYKYIWSTDWPEELYDLERDPHELTNIIATEPERAAELRRLLDSYLDLVGREKITPQRLAPEVRRQLEALGYFH